MARVLTAAVAAALLVSLCLGVAAAQPAPPPLTQPVNDYAHVVDPASARTLDAMIRSLQRATGDVVVVATVDTFQPYGTIDAYAVKMFQNGGRGIGEKGRDNGLLVVVAVNDRRVRVEVGYELEQFVTDGFAGETARQLMIPEFRSGRYGPGLVAGVTPVGDPTAWLQRPAPVDLGAGRATEPATAKDGASRTHVGVFPFVVGRSSLNTAGRPCGRPAVIDQTGRTFSACGPFWPCVTSNSTVAPSSSDL